MLELNNSKQLALPPLSETIPPEQNNGGTEAKIIEQKIITNNLKIKKMNTNVESTEMTGNPVAGLIQSNKENENCSVENGTSTLESIPSNTETETKTIELFGKNYNVVDDIHGLKTISELKDHLPMMNTIPFKKLKADIKKNGMHYPILYIVLPDGEKLVIDGHTRLKAALELKRKSIEIETKEIKQKFENLDDLILWMIQQQFQRRNLSNVEKLQIAFISKETIVKRANANLSKAGKRKEVDNPVDTNVEIAKIAGVSRSTVGRYSSVLDKASEKLINEMHLGKISITAAAKGIKKSPAKKATPATEKKETQVKMFSTYDDGVQSLNKGEIKALVTVKDKKQFELFNSRQLEKVGFLIAEIQQHEPLPERTKADYEELVAL